MADIIFPLASGGTCCLIMQRIKSGKDTEIPSASYNLFVRSLGIVFGLFIGFILENIRSNNLDGTIDFLVAHGLYSRTIYDILFNFNGWFIAALFPFAYATIEVLIIVKRRKSIRESSSRTPKQM